MSSARRPSWWLVAPVCLVAGIGLGRLLPSRAPQPLWTGPDAPRHAPAVAAAQQLPSLAPMVDRVAGGVVGVSALFRADAGVGNDHTMGVANGTGFVVNDKGLVVTSRHVVAEAQEITLWVNGGIPYRGTQVGEDPVNDLAFVRMIDPPAGIPVLELGRSEELRAGDWIVSIGSPLGLPRTVTIGMVSFVGRHLRSPAKVSNDYLQFSAPVNEGNSGGPVLDLDGRVVGVTTRAIPAAQGMSFAVPSRTLKWAMYAADNSPDGKVHRGYLGIEFQPLPGPRFGEWQAGAEVTRVADDSPASGAGIHRGDVVRRIDGAEIRDPYDLHERLSRTLPGTTVELLLQRDHQDLPVLAVTLGEVAAPPANEPG